MSAPNKNSNCSGVAASSPKCRKEVISSDSNKEVSNLKTQLAESENKLSNLETQVSTLINRLNSLEKTGNNFNSQLTNLAQLINSRDEMVLKLVDQRLTPLEKVTHKTLYELCMIEKVIAYNGPKAEISKYIEDTTKLCGVFLSDHDNN